MINSLHQERSLWYPQYRKLVKFNGEKNPAPKGNES
jgi:hypothetical protein